jgi:NDP-sugar pyrophosphorylase family protein
MKAMILAAGMGTRLRPLTNDRPKALVEVRGRTLLETTLTRLQSFGIRDVIINVHHFAEMVVEYLKAHNNFGMNIEISWEDDLLDTGGGLKKASRFFVSDSQDEPFIVHNVDVLSSIDLSAMVKFHRENQALVTLAVQARHSSRYLLFDDDLQLCGRRAAGETGAEIVCPMEQATELAFCGIHVVSPRIFSVAARARMSAGHPHEEHAFPIIPVYLRLAGLGERFLAYRADKDYWRDLGTLESLKRAAEDLEQRIVVQ